MSHRLFKLFLAKLSLSWSVKILCGLLLYHKQLLISLLSVFTPLEAVVFFKYLSVRLSECVFHLKSSPSVTHRINVGHLLFSSCECTKWLNHLKFSSQTGR